jgi:hypothetical protein
VSKRFFRKEKRKGRKSPFDYVNFEAGERGGSVFEAVLTVTQLSPPCLSFVFAPPNLTLSWPTNASAFTLIGTPSLDWPILWMPLTNGITVNGTNETITINAGSGNQYYKLTAP